MTTRHIGQCQICEGDQKLHLGRLVHHGYRRPGDGFIVGDCPGVGAVPYEVSCALVKEHVLNLRAFVAQRTEYLDKLRAGTIKELYIKESIGSGWDRKQAEVKVVAGTPDAAKYDLSHGCTRWERAMGRAVNAVGSDISTGKADIVRCERRVATWAPKPIRTVEEEQRKADAGKAERQAVRQAARDAKAAKKAAYQAKQDALKDRRLATMTAWVEQLAVLSSAPDSEERKAAAAKVAAQMRKAGDWVYSFWYDAPRSFDMKRMEDALVTLRLGERGHNGRVHYRLEGC